MRSMAARRMTPDSDRARNPGGLDETQLAKRIERMSRQLELDPVDVGTVRRWATEFGRQGLVEQLAAIS